MNCAKTQLHRYAKTQGRAMNTEKRVTVNISLTPEEKAKLKIYAAKQGKTVSAVIQEFIATLDEKKKDEV